MLAISVDDLEDAAWVVEELGIPFPILYDTSTETPRDYAVYNLRGDDLAAPGTFVIDRDGIIRWKRVSTDITNRPSVSTILAQLSRIAE